MRATTFTLVSIFVMSMTSMAAEPSRTVNVSARSEVIVDADEVLLGFNVSTKDKDVLTAKARNDVLTRSVIDNVKNLDIQKEYLRMEDFDVSPSHDIHGAFNGYDVQRRFECRIHDFAQVEPLVAELVRIGVDRINRLKFQVKDQRVPHKEARRLAFEYAKEKASHWAELSELKLGKVISVREDVQFNHDAGGAFGGFGGGGLTKAADPKTPIAQNPSSDSTPTNRRPDTQDALFRLVALQQKKEPAVEAGKDAKTALLAPGQMRLNATVTVEFELIDK